MADPTNQRWYERFASAVNRAGNRFLDFLAWCIRGGKR